MTLPAPAAIKVQNLINKNEGSLQNMQIEWTGVSGADGYKIYRSIVPYGNFIEVGDVDATSTKWVDESPTIIATNDRDEYYTYTNEQTIIQKPNFYYCVSGYVIDVDGNKDEGEKSKPSSQEDAAISCSSDRDGIYSIGDYSIYSCGTGAPIPSTNQLLPYLAEIRRRTLAILQLDGQWVWLLKRRVYGERCPYTDIDNNQCRYGTQCTECFGTGMRKPFLDPVLIKMVIIYGPKKEEYEDLGIRTVREAKSWTIWQPKIAPRDIFIDKSGNRYEITSVTKTSPMLGGMYARQDFQYRELEIANAFYNINVPGPVPLV